MKENPWRKTASISLLLWPEKFHREAPSLTYCTWKIPKRRGHVTCGPGVRVKHCYRRREIITERRQINLFEPVQSRNYNFFVVAFGFHGDCSLWRVLHMFCLLFWSWYGRWWWGIKSLFFILIFPCTFTCKLHFFILKKLFIFYFLTNEYGIWLLLMMLDDVGPKILKVKTHLIEWWSICYHEVRDR